MMNPDTSFVDLCSLHTNLSDQSGAHLVTHMHNVVFALRARKIHRVLGRFACHPFLRVKQLTLSHYYYYYYYVIQLYVYGTYFITCNAKGKRNTRFAVCTQICICCMLVYLLMFRAQWCSRSQQSHSQREFLLIILMHSKGTV